MALTKENLLHMWRNIELFAIDEIFYGFCRNAQQG